MPKHGSVHMEARKIQDLIESLQTRPVLQVGVFQQKTKRVKDPNPNLTNADLACYHELGVPERRLPARSVLRTPLHDHAKQIMESVKGKGDILVQKPGKVGVKALWTEIGLACEKVIDGAFQTGGYGKWAPLQRSTLLKKLKGNLRRRQKNAYMAQTGISGIDSILINLGELRRAYKSRVVFRFG